jgi:hypothetical protein
MNVIEWMYVLKYENKQQEWHPATKPVLRIRIHRIHVFLGLPDPDPLVRGMDPDPTLDPDPDPSIIMQKQ